MKLEKNIEKTSVFLHGVTESFRGKERISFDDILTSLHERGFGVLMLVLILPNLLPIPGLTAIGAIPVIFVAAQMTWGLDHPWLPKKLGQQTISFENFEKIIKKVCFYLKYGEGLIKPRLACLSERRGEKVIGLLCLLYALVFALPIPLGNFFPVMGVFMISLGLFNRDGLIIILGTILGVVGVFINIMLVLFGAAAVLKIYSFLGLH